MEMLKVFAVGLRLMLVNLGEDSIKYGLFFFLDLASSETNSDPTTRYLDTVLGRNFCSLLSRKNSNQAGLITHQL